LLFADDDNDSFFTPKKNIASNDRAIPRCHQIVIGFGFELKFFVSTKASIQLRDELTPEIK
jgi:hypothetical protein